MANGSPAVILYDSLGNPMAVTRGAAIPGTTKGLLMAGQDGAGVARLLRTGTSGGLATLPFEVGVLNGAFTGFGPTTASVPLNDIASGYVATAAVTQVFIGQLGTPIYKTSDSIATVVSSSASDAAAGVGARTVKIIYFNANGDGPFTETVTLNGVSSVNTANSNYCTVWGAEVMTVGSTGWNVGNITINVGGTLGTRITAVDNRSFQCHAFSPTVTGGAKDLYITGLRFHSTGNSGRINLYQQPYTNNTLTGFATAPKNMPLTVPIRVFTAQNPTQIWFPVPIKLDPGYAAQAWITPDSTTAATFYCALDYFYGVL